MSSHLTGELLPRRASFLPSQPVAIEARGIAEPGTVRVWHLGDEVARRDYDGQGEIALPPLPLGGYGVELIAGGQSFTTAVSVADASTPRLRYGFVANYSPDRDTAGLADTVRRLHLTDIQFYDWAYRHADLLGGGETYRDALDQPIALATVRDLIAAVQAAGANALGYAAVYAVGPKEWHAWRHHALNDAKGKPYGLGDFLFLVDPATPDWLEHFTADLARAFALGFDGFHLDQYGYPKRARRVDGEIVDIGRSFVTLIEAVRAALPLARLVFNNVNDFPTRLTATAPQDAIYIEVWEPQLTLDALARTVTAARAVAEDKPVVIAAYQHVYDTAPADEADRATALTMATLFSHGATQLLAGEADRILVDPYYVRNHIAAPSTGALLKRWYDFLVSHDDLLMPPGITDVTNAYAGAYNGDLDVTFANAPVAQTATAGSVWRRIVAAGDRLVIHLINLTGQSDTLWDAARAPFGEPGEGILQIRCIEGATPRVRVADPDADGRLLDLDVTVEGGYASARLPALAAWQVIEICLSA